MMRSSLSIYWVRQFSSVVLPEPVPPEIRTFARQRPIIWRISAPSGEIAPNLTSWSRVSLSFLNLRIVNAGPSIASGGTMALTREPSARRASQIGDVVARQKRFKRAVSENVVADIVEQLFLLGDRHHDVLDRDDLVDDVANFLARRLAVKLGELGEIDRLDQGAEDRRLALVIGVGPPRFHPGRRGRFAWRKR